MAIKFSELSQKEDKLAPGHRLCPGCAEGIIVREVLRAIEDPVVVAAPTGCLEVSTTPFPLTSWRMPWIHVAFENASTVIAGAETMYRSLVKQGKISARPIKFVAFGGDGATYDIGLQWLSGVFERGHKVLYICLNNEAYMNTGIQRSGATLKGTWTTTTPIGSATSGKLQNRKNMVAIAAAHDIPYAATAAPHAWRDLMTKVQKAVAADGPAFIDILSPCPRGWRHDAKDTIAISKLSSETCAWPLYEVDHGQWKVNYRPSPKKPITDWFKSQGRFSHLLRPENEKLRDELQQKIDEDWAKLEQRCK